MKEEGSHFPISLLNRIFYFLAQMILCNFKTSGANVALEKKSCGAKGRIFFGANGSLPSSESHDLVNTHN